MDVQLGQQMLHYRIVDKIGEGGMGVVWRAVDTTLDRDVAIKVLPQALAADPDRLARFEREAKLLASLNHPNIAEIYGLHTVDDMRFIAMELISGEDLSQRIQHGALDSDVVLDIAQQIAQALEAAHEQGVIHRDLKPANVQLAPDGRVKVLDFGLAKAFDADPGSGKGNPSMSPTLTSAGTQAGMILGTAAYMSPEQARGHMVDKRADIWALGCIIYEMLTGQIAFRGDTVSDTLAAVLKSEPDWDALPANTSPALRLIVARCLEKDARQRMRDIGEVRIAVERMTSGSDSVAVGGSLADLPSGKVAVETGALRGKWLMLGALTIVAATAAGWHLRPSPEVADPVLRRFTIAIPGIDTNRDVLPRLSPDGRRTAHTVDGQILIRGLDQVDSRELPGSENATDVVWSPDGQQVAWLADGKLWRAPVTGGSRTAVCTISDEMAQAAWVSMEHMVLTERGSGFYEVSARGGDPRLLLDLTEDDIDVFRPSPLPGERGIVYVVRRQVGEDVTFAIETLVDGERKALMEPQDFAVMYPMVSDSGFLLYRRFTGNTGLWAAPLSLESLELTGDPVLIDSEGTFPSVSRDGSLLYFRRAGSSERQLVWVDRDGRTEGTIGEPGLGLYWPALSADGLRVAVEGQYGDSRDIWIYDTQRGTRTRLTFDDQRSWAAAWYPDGSRIAMGRGLGSIVAVTTDGRAETIELGKGEWPDVSTDGEIVVFERSSSETKDDVYFVSSSGAARPNLFLSTPHDEQHVQLSPDGNFLAYMSAVSGRPEIYLQRFPSGEGRWQVSVDGGNWARWSPAGGEMFFLNEGRLMAVDVELAGTPKIGIPRELFSLEPSGLLDLGRTYDVAPDGQRFVMLQDAGTTEFEPTMMFVENWVSGLAAGN